MLRVEDSVVPAVGVAPVVPQPHVVAGVGQDVAETLGGVGDDPVSGGAEEAVLQEDHWSLPPRVGLLAVRDPVERQDVAVTRHRPVLLGRVAVTPDQLRLNRGLVRLSLVSPLSHRGVVVPGLRPDMAEVATSDWEGVKLPVLTPALALGSPGHGQPGE